MKTLVEKDQFGQVFERQNGEWELTGIDRPKPAPWTLELVQYAKSVQKVFPQVEFVAHGNPDEVIITNNAVTGDVWYSITRKEHSMENVVGPDTVYEAYDLWQEWGEDEPFEEKHVGTFDLDDTVGLLQRAVVDILSCQVWELL